MPTDTPSFNHDKYFHLRFWMISCWMTAVFSLILPATFGSYGAASIMASAITSRRSRVSGDYTSMPLFVKRNGYLFPAFQVIECSFSAPINQLEGRNALLEINSTPFRIRFIGEH